MDFGVKTFNEKYRKKIEHNYNSVYYNSRALMAEHWNIANLLFDEVVVEGVENVKAVENRQLLYVSNHLSMADFLIQGYVFWNQKLPIPRFIAGENLNHWPFKNLWKKCGAISVDRNLIKNNRRYARIFGDVISESLKDGEHLLNYAEGGRNYKKNGVGEFQGGIIRLVSKFVQNKGNVWAVPMRIDYDKRIDDRFLDRVKDNKSKRDRCLIQALRARRDNYFFDAGIESLKAGFYDRKYFFWDVASFVCRPFVKNKGKAYLKFGKGFLINDFLEGGGNNRKGVLSERLRKDVIGLQENR